jgi:hypothetical protein
MASKGLICLMFFATEVSFLRKSSSPEGAVSESLNMLLSGGGVGELYGWGRCIRRSREPWFLVVRAWFWEFPWLLLDQGKKW